MGINNVAISINNLSLQYNSNSVIDDICVEIKEGEITCLFGPSGCGKSTLLKAALGYLEPSGGEIKIGTTNASDYDFPIAYVPQNNELFKWMNLFSNVALWHKESLEKIDTMIALKPDLAIKIVGLIEDKKKMPHELSGGMARRTAIARCLATNSKFMFLDEAFISVERKLRREIMFTIRKHIKDNNITCLLVSHDYEEATFMSDRVIFLSAVPSKILKEVIVDLPSERSNELFDSELFMKATLKLVGG